MTDILYTLVYIIPLILTAASTLLPRFIDVSELQNPDVPVIFMLAVAVVLTVIINARSRVRITIIGGLMALILGALLVTEGEMRREWFAANEWVFTALVIAAAGVVPGMAVIRIHPLKPVLGVLLAGVLVSSYWTNIFDKKMSIVSAVFLILTILFEEIRYRERGRGQIRHFVVRTVPFLLVGMLALYYMPTREEPYDWAVAKRIINNIADDIIRLRQRFASDSMGNMDHKLGFSEKARVSGDVGSEPEEMMTVTFGAGAPDVIYLDGKYFEDFDGWEWTESETTYPYMMDTLEAECVMSMVDSAPAHDYGRTVRVDVTYSGQNTRYVFAPVKSIASNIRINDTVISYSDNEIIFDVKKGNTTAYNLQYRLFNQNMNTLPLLIDFGSRIDTEQWEHVRANYGLTGEEYSYEAFLAYRRSLYDGSLWPDTVSKEELSPGVREFLDNAVAGAETDYDKLMALAEAFADFEYTTSPGALPKSVDSPGKFLDYFLLESKAGYCNSFATAFVLLCRAEGIPARYVHGYCVPRTDSWETTVFTNMAHAYPEAYLEGIGWTVFEPTPGYSSTTVWDERGEYEISGYSYVPDIQAFLQQSSEAETVENDETGSALTWYMIVIPAVLCVVALVAIVLIERAVNIHRFERLSSEEKARAVCFRIMNMLKHRGLVKAECETVREYAERAAAEQGIALDGFAGALEKILYSTECLSDDDIAAVNDEFEALKGSLKGKDRFIFDFLSFMGL